MGAGSIHKLGADGVEKGALPAAATAGSGAGRPSLVFYKQNWPGHQIQGPAKAKWTDSAPPFASRNHEPLAESDDETRTLLVSIAEGDRSAFWALWQKYQKHLFAVCLRQMGGIHADAEDALSKAMLKALDTMPRHARAVVNTRAWLTRLTANVCIEMHRERSRRRAKLSSEQGFASVEGPIHSTLTPEETLLRGEIYAFMARTIDRLTTRLREPFVLRFEQEMSCREVGERLMLSSENVRKRIQQARAVLRQEMARFLSGIIGEGPSVDANGSGSTLRQPSTDAQIQAKPDLAKKRQEPAFCQVQVTLPSGERSDFYIVLNQKPTRQHLKLRTLRKYLERHPRGWKKRLETAYLLYTMGHWEEAIGHYRYVLRRQPKLVDAWINMANMLRLSGRVPEAIAAYQTALTLVTRDPTRHALSGLILLCLEDYDGCLDQAEQLDTGDVTAGRDQAVWPCAALGYGARSEATAGD
jgi:RNA polymerase sigma factor (sigma-70 family)